MAVNIHGWNIEGSYATSDEFGRFLRGAFSGSTSGLSVTQTSTPSMAVTVSQGDALLTKNSVSSIVATVKNNIDISITTANPTNPRYDTLIIYEDTSVSITPYIVDGTGGRFKIDVIAGTPAGSPTVLSDATIQSIIGAGKSWTRLADVLVDAGALNIVNSKITRTSVPLGPQANIFSSQKKSATNPGDAGGSYDYLNIGGIKLVWGRTGQMTTTAARVVTMPAGFFSSVKTALLTPSQLSSTGTQIAYLNVFPSTTEIRVNLINVSGVAGNGYIDYIVIGS